jgi:uncharacterized protein YlaN (UPF0358 family)
MTEKKNDAKIKELIVKLEEQKVALGSRPKVNLKTNGIFKYDDKNHFNLNTVNNYGVMIDALGFLFCQEHFFHIATDALGLSREFYLHDGYKVDEWNEDFKSRIELIKWEDKKKLLDSTQKKLDSLVSEEVKTELELDNIAKLLG